MSYEDPVRRRALHVHLQWSDPLRPAHDIEAVAAEAGARLVLASADRAPALADLAAQSPLLIDGPRGPWAAALRLRL